MDGEIEIDLRKVIRTLLGYRLWIIGFGLLAGLVVFLFFFLQPRMYEATAVIALTKPRYLPNFDSRYQTLTTTTLNNKIVLDVAKSDEIAIYVFDSWNDPDKELEQRRAFRENNLIAKAGSDSTVINLTVRLESAEEAARLANLWAQRVIERVNSLYAGVDQEQLSFFEAQISVAGQSLRRAENALAEFEGRNPVRSFQMELDTLLFRKNNLLRRLQWIDDLQREARGLLQETKIFSDQTPVPSELQVRLLVLQLRQFPESTQFQPESPLLILPSSVQYQLPLTETNRAVGTAEFRRAIEDWLAVLDQQVVEIERLLAEYPQNLTTLQQQIEQLNREKERLILERNVAAETYTTLNRKYQEVRITLGDNPGDAKIASRALPPIRPASRGTVMYTLVALVGGVILAAAFVLVREWWRQDALSKTRE